MGVAKDIAPPVAADAYAPVSTSNPDPSHEPVGSQTPQIADSSKVLEPSLSPLALPSVAPTGHVNEVTFGFLDGTVEAPVTGPAGELETGIPALRSAASPGRVSAHSLLSARANPLQHLAGGSGVAGPASWRSLFYTIVLLLMLGIIPSTIIFLVDVAVHNLFSAREAVAVQISGGVLGFFLYLISGVILCILSTMVCHLCSREAEGSGIPQMKAIMSGFYDKMKPALSLWALLAKAVGLVCAIGGGLPVGWEGPNVHISCIVAHHLCRLPFFRSLRRDRALRMQIMACACAVGLASSFGTPIGGVLYALETTASFYLVPTFWKSVVATLAGSLVYGILYKTPLVEAFDSTSFGSGDYTRGQLINFAAMGIIFGLIGAFFVRCVHSVYLLRTRKLPATNRYVLLGVVGAVAAIVQYPLRLFRLDPRMAINEFFSADNLETLSSLDVALLVLIKFPLIVVSIGLPIPAGVFIPSFLLGSGLGRLYGEVLRYFIGSTIVPGGYAVVGAAAFTAGVTRALACAVVIFELTGQLKHMEPTLVAVALSVVVANSINRSLYDTLIIMKELPYMPHMRRDRSPAQRVQAIMSVHVVALKERTTLGTLREVLDLYPGFDSFPVVTEDMLLLGSIRRRTLLSLLNVGPACENLSVQTGDGSKTGGTKKTSVLSRSKWKKRSHDAEERERLMMSNDDDVDNNHYDDVFRYNDYDGDIDGVSGDITAGTNSRQQDRLHGMNDGDVEMVELGNTYRQERGIDHESDDQTDEYGANKTTVLTPDMSPLVVTEDTPLSQLHFMFVMLTPTHAFVLSSGRLTGVVTRGDIVQTGSILVGNTPP